MVIIFKTAKLEKICCSESLMVKEFGATRAKKFGMRLREIVAADNLEVLRTIPQTRCHELIGNRKGCLSVDLDHPYRLIFEPTNDPLPTKPDGGLDWRGVTVVKIIGVEDTHG